jgi:hypothetical protein
MIDLRFRAFGLGILLAVAAAEAQVPPPPPPPHQAAVGEGLVAAFASKNVDQYAVLLADNVQVYEDGKLVAGDKATWLNQFSPMLSAKGVLYTLSPGFSSSGRILFIEYFNSTGSWGGATPADCCWRYDAVAYDVSAGKIQTIRRLNGGTSKLDSAGKVAGN